MLLEEHLQLLVVSYPLLLLFGIAHWHRLKCFAAKLRSGLEKLIRSSLKGVSNTALFAYKDGRFASSFLLLGIGFLEASKKANSSFKSPSPKPHLNRTGSVFALPIRAQMSIVSFTARCWGAKLQGELKVKELRWQREPKTQIFAENRRFSQIRPFSSKFKHLEGAGNRRKPQIFAENRRFSQKTAGNRRLGSVTLGASPLARP